MEVSSMTESNWPSEGNSCWGYLVPLEAKSGTTSALKSICRLQSLKDPAQNRLAVDMPLRKQLGSISAVEQDAVQGYLIGRHSECDVVIDSPMVSNRHFVVFCEHYKGGATAVLGDLSSNGTLVNGTLIGQNKSRQLANGDVINVLDEQQFVFRYPLHRFKNSFAKQYHTGKLLKKTGCTKVYQCTEKTTGILYAVKRYTAQNRLEGWALSEIVQGEIALLASVTHPSLLYLKDTFYGDNSIYLVTELAKEDLFDYITRMKCLAEKDTRTIFFQLFEAVCYLHERNIVHCDLKPENILLTDGNLGVKIADFGVAKIIGEDYFTDSLYGTVSYMAPEILAEPLVRSYSRAVDIWALGVVLYICLCGFPPFSEELNTAANPFDLSKQIQLGRVDYPGPYWDDVCNEALILIDHMLTVSTDERATIGQCLEHDWTLEKLNNSVSAAVTDTDSFLLRTPRQHLDRRQPRERTLLGR